MKITNRKLKLTLYTHTSDQVTILRTKTFPQLLLFLSILHCIRQLYI